MNICWLAFFLMWMTGHDFPIEVIANYTCIMPSTVASRRVLVWESDIRQYRYFPRVQRGVRLGKVEFHFVFLHQRVFYRMKAVIYRIPTLTFIVNCELTKEEEFEECWLWLSIRSLNKFSACWYFLSRFLYMLTCWLCEIQSLISVILFCWLLACMELNDILQVIDKTCPVRKNVIVKS